MRTGKLRRGFTLVEMIIVMTIVSILVSMAVPMFQKSILRMRESVLRNNRFKEAGAQDKKIKFLRRLPRDPFTGRREWGMRNVKDDPTSTSWGGSHVFDVYSKTFEKAADGTAYADW